VKFRSPLLYELVGMLGAWFIRLWMGSLRWRVCAPDRSVDPYSPQFQGRYIYIFWHEAILYPAFLYAIAGVKVLISRHSDGEFITRVAKHLGFGVVRGSTNRGGSGALLELIRNAGGGHLCLTPDGPRGPRRRIQPGVIFLASKTGLPIVGVGFASANPWRGTHWDKFQIPKPGHAARVVGTRAIAVPPDLDADGIEHWRQVVEKAMGDATQLAEDWVDGRIGAPHPELPVRPRRQPSE